MTWDTSERRADTPTARRVARIHRSVRVSLALLASALLLVPAVVAHEPLFGGGIGLRAAAIGAVGGLAVGAIGALAGWRWWVTASLGIAGYFALGSFAALPDQAVNGIWLTAQTLQLLLVQIATAWKDLLTLVPPAGEFVGPSVLPYLTSYLTAISTASLAVGRWRRFAPLPPLLLMFLASAWSVPLRPHALWWGLGFGVLSAVWWVLTARWQRRDRGSEILVGQRARRAVQRQAAAGAQVLETTAGRMLGVTSTATARSARRTASIPWPVQSLGLVATLGAAVLVAAVSLPNLYAAQGRTVLRQYVAPPLNVHDFSNPLAEFRHLSADLHGDDLLRVRGLPEGARVRFATMTSYDGVNWGIAEPDANTSGGFYQVGGTLGEAVTDVPTQARVAVQAEITTLQPLAGKWLPSIGYPNTVRFDDDPGGSAVANSLYYDRELQALLTTAAVPPQLHYTLTGTSSPSWSESQLTGRTLGDSRVPLYAGVPEAISQIATDVTAGTASSLERARALERFFHDQGFYANNTQFPSRPGHSSMRIAQLVGNEQMVGDDEQYATAMALTVNALGMPTRVVLGAYPSAYVNGEMTLTGDDVHAWVEVHFAGAGWVMFDPTPPKDHTPQSQIPQPRSVPQPQVLQPPEPPREAPQLPAAPEDGTIDDPIREAAPFPWLPVVAISALSLVLLIPFMGVPLYKLWRRSQRQRQVGRAAVRAAWREASDYAREVGLHIPSRMTVFEVAESFEAQRPLGGAAVALARQVNRAEFGAAAVGVEDARLVWSAERDFRSKLRPTNIAARYLARISWRTLGMRTRNSRKRASKKAGEK